jgi:hypothetical protein
MPTVWDDATRADLVRRARSLTPAHTARWGRFSVAGMLAHLNDATKMAIGELPVAAKGPILLRLAPVRYLVIHVLPFPKSAPTAPELLARAGDAELGREQEEFAMLLDRLGRAAALSPTHPAFGAMTRRDWGVLAHRHADHHLRQFGA